MYDMKYVRTSQAKIPVRRCSVADIFEGSVSFMCVER